VIVWTVYAYQDELSKKIQFVTSLRKSKEYNKLLQIINILIPSLVRDRIKEGQKNFSDAQGEVTIIFIDIDQFDAIVSQYSGKELIELLDRLYNAFD
jgi:GGDEF domain-containing protein